MKEKLFYQALSLVHANRVGGEMLTELNGLLAKDNLTVDQLLKMSGNEYVSKNAVMATTEVAFGKEFVEEKILSAELIDRLRNSKSLLTRAMFRTMNGKVQSFPVRGVRIRMRSSAEKTLNPVGFSTTAKRAGTAEIVLTAKKLLLTVYYSDELLEDSLVAIAEYVMSELQEAFERSMHEIIINGDTATGVLMNINAIDGDTTALPDGNDTDLLNFDGVRKTAIANGKTVDATGALAITHIRSARAKMGLKGVDPANLAMVPDQDTYFALMNLSQVETIEKFGDSATIKDGVLTAIDGIEIVNREEMGRATASGTVNIVLPINNTKGQIAIVHMPSLNVGFRKGLSTEVSRFAEEQTTGITSSVRTAFTIDNTQNSTKPTSPCALIINI